MGLGFFIAAISAPFKLSLTALRKISPGDEEWTVLHGLQAIALSGVLVLAFNPVILNVPLATFFWLTLGMMVGVAVRSKQPQYRSI